MATSLFFFIKANLRNVFLKMEHFDDYIMCQMTFGLQFDNFEIVIIMQ